ncbi:MAG: glutamate--tRNA ligase family protein [Candidatus Micrarchaeaceae archaeon]
MPTNDEIGGAIRKYSVKNAVEYGKAHEGSVLNKIISLYPEHKTEIKYLAREVSRIIAEVNQLDREALEIEYSKYSADLEVEQTAKAEKSARHNFSIAGAKEGEFTTRFPPEPGGYMHIGHAKPVFIEDELRKVYSGKFALYFDDTNPDNEKQEFVDAFKDDLDWLGIKFDIEYYASDNIDALYGYATEMINNGNAYVCTCSAVKVKEGRASGAACEHKGRGKAGNLELWHSMLEGAFKDNEAILRLNSDMKAKNTTLRDPTLFRIKHGSHYRQGNKYSVWPTYDFCTPIVDSTKGITDVVRSKEYEMRDELYFTVLDMLGLRKPRINSFSRLEIANNVTSKRKIRELIAKGLIDGYDDPRLVTIKALRRRGITAAAIKDFALSFGMGKSESVADLDVLLKMNRKMIAPKARRLIFTEGSDAQGKPDAKTCEIWDIGPLLAGEAFSEASVTKRYGSVDGFAELNEGDVVQFERLGFYKLDSKKERRFISL